MTVPACNAASRIQDDPFARTTNLGKPQPKRAFLTDAQSGCALDNRGKIGPQHAVRPHERRNIRTVERRQPGARLGDIHTMDPL